MDSDRLQQEFNVPSCRVLHEASQLTPEFSHECLMEDLFRNSVEALVVATLQYRHVLCTFARFC